MGESTNFTEKVNCVNYPADLKYSMCLLSVPNSPLQEGLVKREDEMDEFHASFKLVG